MQNSLTYKIIAGVYKGRKLELPSLDSTRSTKNIVRESFFNTLQFDIIDKEFVEVFGGSGSMGLEALSRGASRAYFIELNFKAHKILQKNCNLIDRENSVIILGDSFQEFINLLPKLKNETIFYFDPPFEIREGMEGIYEKTQKLINQIPKNIAFLIAIEHISSHKMSKNIGEYELIKTKKFGNSSISYYKAKDEIY